MDTFLENRLAQFEAAGQFILNFLDPNELISPGGALGMPMTAPSTAVSVVFLYISFVLVMPLVMKAFPPLELYPVKFLYNLSQIMLCSYMTIEAALVGYRAGYTLTPCNNFSTTSPPLLSLLYLFYLSKIWDFWDTVFIVLGKKTKQLSFLHVYHHTTIFFFYWLNSILNYDGDVYLTIVLNGFIHTVMYTYYFVSMHTKIPSKLSVDGKSGTCIPIGWKSWLTVNQLVQFVIMMTQAGLMVARGCDMPNQKIIWTYLFYIGTLFLLFMQFFVRSYITGPAKKGRGKGKKD